MSGSWLYVSSETTGAGSDHFLFVSKDPPGAPRAAPWAKSGTVAYANGTLFLAAENDAAFVGWFDLGTGQAVSGPDVFASKNGVLEGMIDLKARFGAVPATLYLSVAPYASPDGGALYPTAQCPATQNSDGNLDASEIATVSVSGITVP